jgi:hypothetical protein
MSELSPEARALVQDGQSGLRPSHRDRARIASSLAARIGAASLLASQHAAGAAVTTAIGWQKVSALVVGVGLLGAGTAYMVGPPADTLSGPAVTPKAQPTVEAQLSPAPLEARAQAPADSEAQGPTAAEPPPVVRKASTVDRFAEEVAILSKATTALRAGRPAEGLQLLEEHRRSFPNGRLAEERRTARIQALCALGRRSEAEAELARLAQSSPRSPHLARAQRACGAR